MRIRILGSFGFGKIDSEKNCKQFFFFILLFHYFGSFSHFPFFTLYNHIFIRMKKKKERENWKKKQTQKSKKQKQHYHTQQNQF